MIRWAFNLLFAGVVYLFVSSVSFAADPPGFETEILPPPPSILLQVGERYLTTFEIQREVSSVLRPQLVKRERMMEAGTWTKADETRIAARGDTIERQIMFLLRRMAVMEEYAHARGHRPDELRLEKRLLLVARQAGGIESLLRTNGKTLDEIRDNLRGEDMQAQFKQIYVPDAAPPGPRDIREYYAEHRDEMRSPQKVRVRILLITMGDDKDKALAKAEELKRELQYAPDRFEKLAREFSEHSESAARGGLMTYMVDGKEEEWIGVDILVRQNTLVARTILQLASGEVSEVLTSAEGYALLKLEKIKEGRPLTLEEAADPIKKKLALEERERLLRDWVIYYSRDTFIADGQGRKISAEAAGIW